jgi:hypothetical protein
MAKKRARAGCAETTGQDLLRCGRFCGGKSTQKQQISIAFNKERASTSIKISYGPQNSTGFNKHLNRVRDQGVGGSNPLSPTN